MSGKMKCRVCGKEYDVCLSALRDNGKTFRWQKVACSPECGEIYLKRVLEARGIKEEKAPATKDVTTKATTSRKVKKPVEAEPDTLDA